MLMDTTKFPPMPSVRQFDELKYPVDLRPSVGKVRRLAGRLASEVAAHGVASGVPWLVRYNPALLTYNGYAYTFGRDVPDDAVDVHGGVTYSRDSWIGFDCAHFLTDVVPGLVIGNRVMGRPQPDCEEGMDGPLHWWTLDETRGETLRLVAQLIGLGVEPDGTFDDYDSSGYEPPAAIDDDWLDAYRMKWAEGLSGTDGHGAGSTTGSRHGGHPRPGRDCVRPF